MNDDHDRLDEPRPGDENLAIGDMTVLFRW